MGLTFVDYDHDGDLDLYVARASAHAAANSYSAANASNELWRNNGNGKFTEVTQETGLGGDGQSGARPQVTSITIALWIS